MSYSVDGWVEVNGSCTDRDVGGEIDERHSGDGSIVRRSGDIRSSA